MTDDNSLKIHLDDFNVVLNAIASSEDEIWVEHLSDTIGRLYTFKVGGPHDSTIRFDQSADQYAEARSEIIDQQAQAEVPDRNSYVRSFTTSVLDFTNQSDIDDFVERFANRDPSAGHRDVYGLIDSNLIRWQLGDSLGIEPNGDGLHGSLLVTGVRDELQEYGGEEKIQSISVLKEELHSKYGRLFNQFKGQRREQRLGLEYYQYLDKQVYSVEITSDPSDENILAASETFQQESGYDLLFFSNDANAVEMAREKNILAHRVDFPSFLGRQVTVSWSDFALLLYVHAMLFGIIRLPKVDLYGVWTGSRGDTAGHFLVDFRSDLIRHRVERDLSTLETWRTGRE